MRALVVGSAPGTASPSLLARLAAETDLVVAADGGGAACLAAEIVPFVVVGDLDSLGEADAAALRGSGTQFVTVPAKKDETDLDLAVAEARSRGADRLWVSGVLGGRLDHTLASVGTLAEAADLWPVIVEDELTAWILSSDARDRLVLAGAGATVSILAIRGQARVSCAGFRYPLTECLLDELSSRGISNVIEEPVATVTVTSGCVLVVTTRLHEQTQAREASDSPRQT